MTYSVFDSSPPEWHRFTFSNAYLWQVDNYLTENKTKTELSGAISRSFSWANMDTSAPTIVAFQDEAEYTAFKTWFDINVGSWPADPNHIVIARSPKAAGHNAAEKGSKVTKLPTGEYDPLQVMEDILREMEEKNKKSD